MANSMNLQLAGYYAACELFNDNSIDKAPGTKIADKIAENYPNACFAIVSSGKSVPWTEIRVRNNLENSILSFDLKTLLLSSMCCNHVYS